MAPSRWKTKPEGSRYEAGSRSTRGSAIPWGVLLATRPATTADSRDPARDLRAQEERGGDRCGDQHLDHHAPSARVDIEQHRVYAPLAACYARVWSTRGPVASRDGAQEQPLSSIWLPKA